MANTICILLLGLTLCCFSMKVTSKNVMLSLRSSLSSSLFRHVLLLLLLLLLTRLCYIISLLVWGGSFGIYPHHAPQKINSSKQEEKKKIYSVETIYSTIYKHGVSVCLSVCLFVCPGYKGMFMF